MPYINTTGHLKKKTPLKVLKDFVKYACIFILTDKKGTKNRECNYLNFHLSDN